VADRRIGLSPGEDNGVQPVQYDRFGGRDRDDGSDLLAAGLARLLFPARFDACGDADVSRTTTGFRLFGLFPL
jgi:hypothetical protein